MPGAPRESPANAGLSHAGDLVLVVEGEKTADALARLDVFATTCPMGAGKWTDDYAAALVGAHVVVCPDCDLPGRKHAVTTATSLLEHGAHVFGPLELFLDRQDGFDLVDYLGELAVTCRAVSRPSTRTSSGAGSATTC